MGAGFDAGTGLQRFVQHREGRLDTFRTIGVFAFDIEQALFVLKLTVSRGVLVQHHRQNHDGGQPQRQADEVDDGEAPVAEEVAYGCAEIDL